MIKYFIICFLTIVHWQVSIAQFKDDFTDNDFTNNPTWAGNEQKFTVNKAQLKLQATAVTSNAYLSTVSQAINNATWEFYIQMDFNPTSANQAKVYLVSDTSDFTTSLNGYFVKVGNSQKEVSLYRRDGTVEVKIIDGLNSRLNTATVKVNIKVVRDDQGNWQLYSDAGVTGAYALEGIASDATYKVSKYFGIQCDYTSTRSDKFYFDNFSVIGTPFKDIIPPVLLTTQITSINEIELSFSEPLDVLEAQNVMNYRVDHGLSYPLKAELLSDQKTIKISFSINFPNGINCQLSVFGVKDISGNTMLTFNRDFLFFQPVKTEWRDVVVTEILADPDPVIHLPDVEYIELLNRSKNPVDLNNWILSDGSSVGILNSRIILPNDYIIVTSLSSLDKFSAFQNVVGIKNFPTLNNAADQLLLKSADGVIIDSLNYKDTWYKDDDKKEGGWSLERIDPDNICAEGENWTASEDEHGGTPGIRNSVYANNPDLNGPRLVSAIPESSKSVILTFNEKLNKSCLSTCNFLIDPKFIGIKEKIFFDEALTSLKITLDDSLAVGVTYSLTASDIYDCAGNIIQTDFGKIDFGLPQLADSLDIVINEILFNPTSTGVDFVEIYNNSSKFIDLKNWLMANVTNGVLTNTKILTNSHLLFKPFSYLVLTENANVLKSEYPLSHLENFAEVRTLPSLNDDEGSIALVIDAKRTIDYFAYTKNMHSLFIKNDEGVSLERISFSEPSNASQNWKSASSTSGYATPGYQNSNFKLHPLTDESVTVEPEIFIPVYGAPDFTQIKYNFDKGGYVANIKICDIDGREIKQLSNNQTLDTQGSFRWDGDNNKGEKARVGYYFVWFEVFDATGSAKIFRKRIIVATRF